MKWATRLGEPILQVAECASTNDLAANSPAGTAIIAGRQTAGRGQYGRVWDAPAGSSLLMSVACGARSWPAPVLTAWATVAVAEAIQTLVALPVTIKWPNDLLHRGRKLCGILVESGHQLVIGVGLNLTRTHAELLAVGLPDAGSLLSESGVRISVEAAANAVLESLRGWEPTPGQIDRLEAAWVRRLGFVGQQVQGERLDGSLLVGRAVAVGFAGLVLEDGVMIPLETIRRVRLVGH